MVQRRQKPNRQLHHKLTSAFGSAALAVAIAEAVAEHVKDVAAKRVSTPAHRRKDESVVGIWRDLRLETLSFLFNHGTSDLFLLSEHERQHEILDCFLVSRPYLEMPQPRGEPLPDTLQAVWKAYHYLNAVGSEVCDKLTDRETLRLKGGTILDALVRRAEDLRTQLGQVDVFLSGDITSLPPTFLEAVYDDITAKTKSIALSTKFGPNPQAGIKWLEDELKKSVNTDDDLVSFRKMVQRTMAAKSPDDFLNR